ncbi:LacI family DNA-binding transcriptional regulator [Enterococcus massiliensis]|uniref:LacI family DNA-binding transcriptional regulator n=1 Tax=Enterococcus massiliensis TaxID=1640685 RepID=UPI00065E757C|nr:LacI family DNA-binding transcriptional regulator [Enterococcus massiliensis]
MANIRDIAKLTGYSVSTISRVINDYPYVNEEKRQKVLAVMKELQYTPNRTARNLSYGKTKNIGVIVPFTDHPYFDQLVSGIIQAAFKEGYKVTLLPTNYDPDVELGYLDEFAAKGFDGLIITSRANLLEKVLHYQQYGKIIFCEELPGSNVSSAFIDRKPSIKKALLFMKAQGVQRLGVTLGRSGKMSFNSQITIELCKEIFAFDDSLVFWDCVIAEDGLQAAEFFRGKVDGIFTNGDEIAAVIKKSYEKEASPLVVGRENLLISQVMNFSTIDHHLPACGAAAFRLFYENRQEQIRIPYTFIPRT